MINYFSRQYFTWSGLDKDNRPLSGTILASSMAMAKLKLSQQNISTTYIKKRKLKLTLSKAHRPLSAALYIFFFRQLATLLQAGIPLHQCCDILLKGQINKHLHDVVQQIQSHLAQGETLASSLRQQSFIFDPLSCHLIAIGEKTGTLVRMINRIADYHAEAHRLRSNLWQALAYPLAISGLASLITLSLLLWVVPQFQDFFQNFQGTLPRSTRLILSISAFVRSHGFCLLAVTSTTILLFLSLKNRLTRTLLWQKYVFTLPIVGDLLRKSYLMRFFMSLSIMLKAGLPITESCYFLVQESQQKVMIDSLTQFHHALLAGKGIFQATLDNQFFTAQARQMIKVGEETGSIDLMCEQIAAIYTQELTTKINRFSRIIEPLIIVILGALIGGLVIALYLPIFTLGNVI